MAPISDSDPDKIRPIFMSLTESEQFSNMSLTESVHI